MQRQAVIGIILIVIGVAGLLFVGRASWGEEPGDWRWNRGPMMRGFGRGVVPGPWAGPGGRGRVLPPAAGARTIEIVATDSACQPAEVSIKTGETVNIRLVNQGAAPHGLVMPQQGVWLLAPPGQSVTSGIKTDQSGEYRFFCGAPRQREAGTIGRIIVTP